MTTNRITPELRAAMKQPGNRTVVLEMTPERRERMKRISHQIVELLCGQASPVEAFMILQLCTETLQKSKGIVAGTMLTEEADQT
jgi:hypothetical protein